MIRTAACQPPPPPPPYSRDSSWAGRRRASGGLTEKKNKIRGILCGERGVECVFIVYKLYTKVEWHKRQFLLDGIKERKEKRKDMQNILRLWCCEKAHVGDIYFSG
jgi:hypothetical protein